MTARRNLPASGVAAAVTLALLAPALRAAEVQVLDEVIVTAERRAQNLQDVPISATVFDARELDRRGVTDLNDIQNVAPSVAINVVNRSTFVNI
ncbi:MAG: TonB-dependent receptor, partial [Steroidobacteraceae bacterium]